MRRQIACLGVSLVAFAAVSSGADLNVQALGAMPDGQTDCAAAIQQALDAAGKAGGRVHVKRAWVSLAFAAGAEDGEARDCVVTQWHNDAFDAADGARRIQFIHAPQ